MFIQLEPGFMSKLYKKREAKLGGELAETKIKLKEYKDKAKKFEAIRTIIETQNPDSPSYYENIVNEILEVLGELSINNQDVRK